LTGPEPLWTARRGGPWRDPAARGGSRAGGAWADASAVRGAGGRQGSVFVCRRCKRACEGAGAPLFGSKAAFSPSGNCSVTPPPGWPLRGASRVKRLLRASCVARTQTLRDAEGCGEGVPNLSRVHPTRPPWASSDMNVRFPPRCSFRMPGRAPTDQRVFMRSCDAIISTHLHRLRQDPSQPAKPGAAE